MPRLCRKSGRSHSPANLILNRAEQRIQERPRSLVLSPYGASRKERRLSSESVTSVGACMFGLLLKRDSRSLPADHESRSSVESDRPRKNIISQEREKTSPSISTAKNMVTLTRGQLRAKTFSRNVCANGQKSKGKKLNVFRPTSHIKRKVTPFFLGLLLTSCVYTPVSPLGSLYDKQKEWAKKGLDVTVQCGRTVFEGWRATTDDLWGKISPNSTKGRQFFMENAKNLGVVSNLVSGGAEGLKGLGPVPVCFWAAASRPGLISHSHMFGFQLRGRLVQIFATPAYDKIGELKKYLLSQRTERILAKNHNLLIELGSDDPNASFLPVAKRTIETMRSLLGVSFTRTTNPEIARKLAKKLAGIGLPIIPEGPKTAFIVEGLFRKEGPYRHASFVVTESGNKTPVVSWAGYIPKGKKVDDFFMSLWKIE